MEPLEFCDLCFRKGKPNLCETYKNTFTKISSLHFSQQTKVDKILNKLEVRPRLMDRRWTCVMDASKRKNFLDLLYGIGITVHTLDDHVKILTKFYTLEKRSLGTIKQFELSSPESWEEFNPKSRNWDYVKVNNKNNKFFTRVRLGNILKHNDPEGTRYFRTYLNEDFPVLAPMEKRGAFNIMATLAEQDSTYWKTDKTNEYGVVENEKLQNIPDEILTTLQRLGVTDKRFPNLFVFEIEDFELVKTVLNCIKIDLVKSSEKITSLSDNKSTCPIPLNRLEKERLQVLLEIIKEIGGKIEDKKDHFTITGKHGVIKMSFIDDEKSFQDGTAVRISISALEDPRRFMEILNMIKKRLGLLDLPLETMISKYWPIINDKDLQYVIQSAISWWTNNSVLASNIIGEHTKFSKIKEWYSKIKEGKIRSNLDTVTLGRIIKFREDKQ